MSISGPQKRLSHSKPSPFCLRLSLEERAALETAAAGMPLGAFIRETLFSEPLTPRRTRGHTPVKDHAALAKVLGALGNSHLSSNINQIAKAAHIGALPVTDELAIELTAACADLHAMRQMLMRALGFAAHGESRDDLVSATFGKNAAARPVLLLTEEAT